MHHATRASVSREERARKVLKRAAMEEGLGTVGPIVCQGSGWDCVNEIRKRVEKRNGVEPASSLATDSSMDCER